jgi:DNA-binding IscR family transcriptional regulator
MLKQQDMTETAAAVLHFLPSDKWTCVDDVARITGISAPRCQLILTQLSMAGLVKENGGDSGKFTRCQ